jgi:hypothetical protein
MVKKRIYLEARELYITNQLIDRFPCRLTYLGFVGVKKVKNNFVLREVEFVCEDEKGTILENVKISIDKEKFLYYLRRQYGN